MQLPLTKYENVLSLTYGGVLIKFIISIIKGSCRVIVSNQSSHAKNKTNEIKYRLSVNKQLNMCGFWTFWQVSLNVFTLCHCKSLGAHNYNKEVLVKMAE